MSRRMIWPEDERLTGWYCSQCGWGLIALTSRALLPRQHLTGLLKRVSRSTPAHTVRNREFPDPQTSHNDVSVWNYPVFTQ